MGLGNQLFRGSLWQRTVAILFNQLDAGHTYSTSETATNKTWTDGKRIYQKTINFGALPDTTSTGVAHGISGIDTVVSLRGIAVSGSVRVHLPHVNVTNVANGIGLVMNSTNVTLVTGTDWSAYTGLIFVEYTKT